MDKIVYMPKLFHTPKSNIIGPFFILPLFLYFAYEGIVNSNILLSIGSIVVWLAIVLFTINYWFQAIVLFACSFIAFYFKYWWAGILLILLSAYMVNAAKMVERGELDNIGEELREKFPVAGKIIDLLQDKKKMRILIIILLVFSFITSFITLQSLKSP